MGIIIGSARHDEHNSYTNGAKGDSLQTSTPDYKGEVSMQNFYVHKKGWNIARPKDRSIASKIAQSMKKACNNKNLGYSQNDRYAVIRDGIETGKPSNCDCSSLVRACVKEATGKDPGDFTTSNAMTVLSSTGLFYPVIAYTPGMILMSGDILCTKTKGHIVVVTDGDDPAAPALDPNGNPYNEPTKNVRLNSKGNDVRWLQVELNRRGYKLVVNGHADAKTIEALIDFQTKAFPNLPSEWDGICGPRTREKLKAR